MHYRFFALLFCFFSVGSIAETYNLSEIVVTAELRKNTLLDHSGSTTVLSEKNLKQLSAQHLEDVLNSVPNLNFSGGTSRARFFQIRGIGERSQYAEPINPSVGLLIDDIDFTGIGNAATMLDVAQVEVLRGPQGTLHGANAMAGLINVRSNEPQSNPFNQISLGIGYYDHHSFQFVSTGPLISDSLLYRFALGSNESNGSIKNRHLEKSDTNDIMEITSKFKLEWTINPKTKLSGHIFFIDTDNGFDAFSLDNSRNTLSDEPGKDTLKTLAGAIKVTQDFSPFTLNFQASFSNSDSIYSYDEDWTFVGIAPGWEYKSFDSYARERDAYSLQARLTSKQPLKLGSAMSDWSIGLYSRKNNEDLVREYTYATEDFSSEYDTDTNAIFGDIKIALTESFRVGVGLRLENRDTFYQDSDGVRTSPEKDMAGGRFSLEYLNEDYGLWYLSYGRGYRGDGVNAGVLSSPDISAIDRKKFGFYDSESLTNLEAGIKYQSPQENFSGRLSIFKMDRRNQQVKDSLVLVRTDGSSAFIDHTNNTASGDNYGVELETLFQLNEGLSVTANLGLLRSKVHSYLGIDGVTRQEREQPQAPSYQYSIGIDYRFSNEWRLNIRAEGKDEYFFSNRHGVKAPSLNMAHARLVFERNPWNMGIWIRNMTDEETFVRGFGSFGNNPLKEYVVEPYYQRGSPRTFGAEITFQF